MSWKAFFIGLFIAVGLFDVLLIWACHELEKRRKK